jgi:hypothetical protein
LTDICLNAFYEEIMKAIKTPVAQAVSTITLATEFHNLKNAGYSFAVIGDYATNVAKYVFQECPSFLDSIPKEVDAQLTEGFALKAQELRNDAVHIPKRFNNEWIPDPQGGVEVTIAYAMSFSQQEFGRMRIADPVKHGVIKSVRDAFSKYKNARMTALRNAIKSLNKETKPRKENKDYATFISDTMTAILDKAKSVSARNNDATCDQVKTRMAVDAFNKVWNK